MNRPTIALNGVFPPIPTPFDGRGDIVREMLIENLRRWNQHDLAGYVVLGSNGESVYLTAEEKVEVWRTARQSIPAEKLLIAGTGCESTRQTIALSSRAADEGADAVLVLTPHYYDGQMTADALMHHFEAVADRAPVPVVLYNMPRFTQVDMDAATVARIARHPNVIGIKDSGGDVAKLAQIVGTAGEGFQVLAGSASIFFPGLTVGAVGGVMALANIAPQAAIALYRLFKGGDWDEAAALQQRLVPVNTAVTSRFGIPGLKAALDMIGYYGGPVRSPLQPLDQREIQALEAILVEGSVL
jgi:4-hydroxy-2-oxoglutarate aldolase